MYTTITIIFINYCTLVALQSQQVVEYKIPDQESSPVTLSEYVPASNVEEEVSYHTRKGIEKIKI